MSKVEIDKELCIGCGICVSICPKVFELTEDSKAYVKENVDLKSNNSDIEEAETSCPEQAITIKETNI